MEDKTPDITFNPRRKSAKVASAAFASQLDSDSLSGGSEAEAESSKGKRRASGQLVRNWKRPRTKTKPVLASGDTTLRPRLGISTQTTESTSTIVSSGPNVAKLADSNVAMTSTQLAQAHGLEDLSDLTSLSSDEHPPSPDDVEPKYKLLAKPFPMISLQGPTSTATTSKPKPLKATTSRVLTSKASTLAIIKPKAKPKPVSKEFGLGTYVWVLVQPETLQLYDQAQDEGKGLWWPGKVQKCRTTNFPLEVKLFGEGFKTVQIPSPSKDNIISQSNPFTKMKFKDPTYVSLRTLSFDQVSSRKKQDSDREDTKEQWKVAVKAMRHDEEIISIGDSCSDGDVDPLSATDDEDLPIYIKPIPSGSKSISAPPKTTFSQSSKGALKGKGKKGKGKGKEKPVDIGVEDYYADGPDVLLEIPGELVLARDKAHTNIYWPARIEAYVPGAKPTQPGKYTITWVDSSSQDVPRAWFYIFSDIEFATCKVGSFYSLFGEGEDDKDEDELVLPEEDRSASPVPLDPPPSSEDFKTLPIREQLAYTKEALRAILDDRYAPSRQKHDDFIKGGKWRKNVSNAAAMRGMMSPADVNCLHKLVQNWCLRDVEGHTMDIVEEHSQESIVIDDIQDDAKSNHHEATNSTIPPPASGDATVLEPIATDDAQEGSKSDQLADLTLLMPAFNHQLSAESTLPQALAGDIHADIAILEPTAIDNVQQERDSVDDVHQDSAIRFGSPSVTEGLASSPPPEVPPSSLMPSLVGYESSQSDILPPFSAPEAATSPPPSSLLAPTFVTESTGDDIRDEISVLTDMEDDQSLPEAVVAPKERVFVPFESLTQIAKIEYCSNVLVPESIRQILLWRSGDRTQVNLLTPEEEQALYDKGSELLTERDWVFDVMRLRQTKVASIDAKKAKRLQAMGGSSSMSLKSMHSRNGSSSRPRRNQLVQNYQE